MIRTSEHLGKPGLSAGILGYRSLMNKKDEGIMEFYGKELERGFVFTLHRISPHCLIKHLGREFKDAAGDAARNASRVGEVGVWWVAKISPGEHTAYGRTARGAYRALMKKIRNEDA